MSSAWFFAANKKWNSATQDSQNYGCLAGRKSNCPASPHPRRVLNPSLPQTQDLKQHPAPSTESANTGSSPEPVYIHLPLLPHPGAPGVSQAQSADLLDHLPRLTEHLHRHLHHPIRQEVPRPQPAEEPVAAMVRSGASSDSQTGKTKKKVDQKIGVLQLLRVQQLLRPRKVPQNSSLKEGMCQVLQCFRV